MYLLTPLLHSSDVGDAEIEAGLVAPCQLSLPINTFTSAELRCEIKQINIHKAPDIIGFDLIIGEILTHLLRKALVLLKIIYNNVLRLVVFLFNGSLLESS